MIVVADTSPICYLLLTGCVDVLPAIFGQVEIPEAVRAEQSATDAPSVISEWIARPPEWLTVHLVKYEPDAALRRLHAGEREAIILAEQTGADLILLDEKAARQVATSRDLRVTGTHGILKEAAARGLVDLPTIVENLKQTIFRVSPRLLQNLLKEDS